MVFILQINVEVQEIVPKKQRYANYNNINYNRDPMY
jgi:hypothetical protein